MGATPKYNRPPSRAQLKRKATAFTQIDSEYVLATLLKTDLNQLRLLHLNPRYKIFEILKKDGSYRTIEDPEQSLKRVLRWINHYLQAVYYFQRPQAVYGFCISSREDQDRNIMTNALRHTGNAYVLNLDIKDFFHSVSTTLVHKIFSHTIHPSQEEVIELLTALATFRGRLPMGSPASPVLSNMASLAMDAELAGFCKGASIVYTRYVDDMTFSAQQPIGEGDRRLIEDIIQHHYFVVNEGKVRYYEKGETPVVTGLLVKEDKVDLPPHYLPMLEKEIGRLRDVLLVEERYRLGVSNKKLKLLKQEIAGKLNFATIVLGDGHPDISKIQAQFEAAQFVKADFESADWLELPYDVEVLTP